jgi:hypothetical protein
MINHPGSPATSTLTGGGGLPSSAMWVEEQDVVEVQFHPTQWYCIKCKKSPIVW